MIDCDPNDWKSHEIRTHAVQSRYSHEDADEGEREQLFPPKEAKLTANEIVSEINKAEGEINEVQVTAKEKEVESETNKVDGETQELEGEANEIESKTTQIEGETSEVEGETSEVESEINEVEGNTHAEVETSEVEVEPNEGEEEINEGEGGASEGEGEAREGEGDDEDDEGGDEEDKEEIRTLLSDRKEALATARHNLIKMATETENTDAKKLFASHVESFRSQMRRMYEARSTFNSAVSGESISHTRPGIEDTVLRLQGTSYSMTDPVNMWANVMDLS